MRLTGVETIDYCKDIMPQLFCNALGEELTSAQLAKAGYENMEFYGDVHDVNKHDIGCTFRKNGYSGVYDISGKLYADFVYKEQIRHILPDSSAMYFFKFETEKYDVFLGTELLYTNVNSYKFMDDEVTGEERYCLIYRNNKQTLYDMQDKKEILTTCLKDYHFESIHSGFELIICWTDKNSVESFVLNFSGGMEYTNTLIDEELFFTGYRDFYLTCKTTDEWSIIHFESGKLERVTDKWYSYIGDVLQDRAVVFSPDCRNTQIIKYSKTGDDWKTEIEFDTDKYIEDIKIFENEKDAIICLENSKKMLLSNYEKLYKEQFICDEIIYEGNNIFKCFNEKPYTDLMDITYICCEQAVNYVSKNDKAQLLFLDETNEEYIIIKNNGEIIFRNTDILDYNTEIHALSDIRNFMTIKPEGTNNLIKIVSGMSAIKKGNYVINAITGAIYEFKYQANMVWHNLFEVDDELYLIEKSVIYDRYKLSDVVAMFNEQIVIKDDTNVYICNRDFAFILGQTTYNLDTVYQKLIVPSVSGNMRYVISNDGIEYFDYDRTIRGKQVYKSRVTNNYVVDLQYVYIDNLKEDLKNGFVHSDYNVLL